MRPSLPLFLLLTGFAPTALAEDSTTSPEKKEQTPSAPSQAKKNGTAPASEVKPEGETEEPEKLYAEGKAAFARGEYAAALELFAEVHRITNHPALLFNMAQAHRLSGVGHCTEAIQLYRAYLKQEESVPNEAEVRERIAELEACAAEEAEQERAIERERMAQEQRLVEMKKPAPPLAKFMTYAGGALVIVGGGLLAATHVKYSQTKDECPCEPGRFSTWETTEKVGWGLLGGGTPLLIGGGLWWWSSERPAGAEVQSGELPAFKIGYRGTF